MAAAQRASGAKQHASASGKSEESSSPLEQPEPDEDPRVVALAAKWRDLELLAVHLAQTLRVVADTNSADRLCGYKVAHESPSSGQPDLVAPLPSLLQYAAQLAPKPRDSSTQFSRQAGSARGRNSTILGAAQGPAGVRRPSTPPRSSVLAANFPGPLGAQLVGPDTGSPQTPAAGEDAHV